MKSLQRIEETPPFLMHPTLSKDLIFERLNSLYKRVLSIKESEPTKPFNRNIAFIEKLCRKDPLVKKALQVLNLKELVLKDRRFTENEMWTLSSHYKTLAENRIRIQNEFNWVEKMLAFAENSDELYQAMAAASYYQGFHLHKIIKTPFGDYQIAKIIETEEGLRALFFEPENGAISPILSIRGTVLDSTANALDDLQPSIGSLAFESGKEELFHVLKTSLSKFPQGTIILGHSLGGAIAQHIAAASIHEGLISEVRHYNAPGIGCSIANRYRENLKIRGKVPSIIEMRHKDDLYSFFGADHLPPTSRIMASEKEAVTYKVAHEILILMEKCHTHSITFEVTKMPDELGFWFGKYNYFTLETVRWVFAPLLRLAVPLFFPKKKIKKKENRLLPLPLPAS